MGVAYLMNHGTSSSLAFEVKQYNPMPDTPSRDNIIGVETDVVFPAYVMSYTEPAQVTNGMLWIKIAPVGAVSLSLTNKNPIIVSLEKVVQYVGEPNKGYWKNREAWFSIKSGDSYIWKPFSNVRVNLYMRGTPDYQCTTITGGWSAAFNGGGAFAEVDQDRIRLEVSNSGNFAEVVTNGNVNTSGYSKIVIKTGSMEKRESRPSVRIRMADGGEAYIGTLGTPGVAESGTVFTLPLEEVLNGKVCLRLDYGTDKGKASYLDIYEVRLE